MREAHWALFLYAGYITPILILLSVMDGSIFLLSFRANGKIISYLNIEDKN